MSLSAREQRDSGDDKNGLCRGADSDVDDHAGGGLRPRNAALMGKPGTDGVAAHACDRQQGADGFADPTHPHEAEAAGTPRSRKQLSPGGRVKIYGHKMIQRYRREPPAEDQHGGGHIARAALDDKKDDEQEAEKRSDDQRG